MGHKVYREPEAPAFTDDDDLPDFGAPEVDLDELAGLAQREAHMQRMAEDVSRKTRLAYYASHLLSEERTGHLCPQIERMLDEELAAGKVTRADLQGALDALRAGASVSVPHGQARAIALWASRKRPSVAA